MYCTVGLLNIAIYVAVRSLTSICSNTIKLLQLLTREGKREYVIFAGLMYMGDKCVKDCPSPRPCSSSSRSPFQLLPASSSASAHAET